MAEVDEGNNLLPPLHKKRRVVTGRSTNSFLRSWAWKREHRPDSVRFEQPYVHTLRVPGEAADRTLSIQQAPFNAEGFASTVWDSSIVVAKFLDKQAALATAAGSGSNSRNAGGRDCSPADSSPPAGPAATEDAAPPATESAAATKGATAAQHHARCEHPKARADAAERPDAADTCAPAAEAPAVATKLQQSAAHALPGAQHLGAGLSLRGRRCLDLSAGCGLVASECGTAGIVMALLGGRVTATDLSPNLPLLRTNCAVNAVDQGEQAVRVLEHEWGTDAAVLGPAFDVIVACDVMYIDDAVQPLVQTLATVSDDSTRIYIAHGRNRQAEASFLAAAREDFDISELPSEQLDDVYQCSDVAVWLLKRRTPLSQP